MTGKYFKFIFLITILVFSAGIGVNAAEGDSKSEAKVATLGVNTGTLSSSSDDFWFVFSGETTKAYEIALTGPSGSDLDMDVLDQNDNHVGGAYGVNYPDTTTVSGDETYYIHIYSAGGSGDFTVEINESEPGSHYSAPLILDRGVNSINTENFTDNHMYARFNDFSSGDFFEISLNVLTSDSFVDAYFYNNDGYSTSIYNNSENSDEESVGYILGSDYDIEVEIYFYSDFNNEVLFELIITQVEAPMGMTREDSYGLAVGETTVVTLFEGQPIYANLTIEDNDWYAFNFVNENDNSSWFEVSYETAQGNWFKDSYGVAPRTDYILHEPGVIYLRLYTWYDDFQNISITVTRESPPPGYTPETAIEIADGDSIEAQLAGQNTFFSASVVEDQSYVFDIDFIGTKNYDFFIYTETNQYGYYNDFYDNTGELYFVADSSSMMIIVQTYSVIEVNATFGLTSVPLPDHSTMEDAKPASVGDNNGETIYNGQVYWFEFTGEQDVFYELYLNSYSTWGGIDIFDSNGQRMYNDGFFGGTQIFIQVTLHEPGSFDLVIEEGDYPDFLITQYYSNSLQAGDFFEWEFSLDYHGYYGYGSDMELDDSIVRIDVLQNSPSLNQYQPSSNAFSMSMDGEFSEIWGLEPFLLPFEIDYNGEETYSGIDIIEDMGFGSGEITEENGQYIMSYEETETNGDMTYLSSFEVIYDVTTHHLVSLELQETYSNGTEIVGIEASINLIDFKISGPVPEDDPDAPPLTIPFQGYMALIVLVIIPLLRRRKL